MPCSHVYSHGELHRLAAMVPVDRDSYVMFNNIPRVSDAERFTALLDMQRMAA